MESLIGHMDTVQIVDNGPSHVEADCLGISLILRKVFQHCSTRDLVKFGRVNKLWNYEARRMLRDRGILSACVTSGRQSCAEELRRFGSYLRRMKEMNKFVPFSGMTINLRGNYMDHEFLCGRSSTREMSRICDEILCQMPLRHLTVSCGTRWQEFDNCPGFKLLKKVLKSHWENLEELSLRENSSKGGYIERVLKQFSFPRLKILKIQNKDSKADVPNARLIKALVSHAPNLQELHIHGPVDLTQNLLEGSPAAVLVTDNEYTPGLHEIHECIAGQLRLSRVNFEEARQDLNKERFRRTTLVLLQSSRSTLTSMKVNAMFLVPLMHYGVCLENVRALDLWFALSGYEISTSKPSASRLIESFDFNRIFPNLSAVHIIWATDYRPNHERIPKVFLDLFDEENAAGIEPMPDRAVNIKKLSLDFRRGFVMDSCSQFLVQMFPDIESLSVRARDVTFVNLWDSWLNLKQLDITLRIFSGIIYNWDCNFCGIFSDEVRELLKQDEEYLRHVNIVPVKPSFTCLKGLTSFSFSLEDGNRTKLPGPLDDPTFLFSKVTGLLAFQRRPDLTVTLATTNRSIKKALRHMKPYANVVLAE